jgi:hypothetical protein
VLIFEVEWSPRLLLPEHVMNENNTKSKQTLDVYNEITRRRGGGLMRICTEKWSLVTSIQYAYNRN